MGCLQTKDKNDEKISQGLKEHAIQMGKEIKLLLLGAGGMIFAKIFFVTIKFLFCRKWKINSL